MSNRLALHNLLLSIAGPNVYYQAPNNLAMKYPAIVYSKSKLKNKHANDSVYYQKTSYSITVISKTIDDDIVEAISKLSQCSYERRNIIDGLYQDIFEMYY